MPPYRLTRRARADLTDLARHTARVWGKAQRDTYVNALYRRFLWLAEDPGRGRPRPEIGPGVRSYPQGAHAIFYAVEQGQVAILAVPHQARDLHAHFEGETE